MRAEEISDALEHIGEEMLAEAEALRQNPPPEPGWDATEEKAAGEPAKPVEKAAAEPAEEAAGEPAAKPVPKTPRRKPWRRWGLLAACLCLLLAGAWMLPGLLGSGSAGKSAEAGGGKGEAAAEGDASPAEAGAGEAGAGEAAGSGSTGEVQVTEAQAPYVLAAAAYPEMAARPEEADYRDAETGEFDSEAYMEAWGAWREGLESQRSRTEDYMADGTGLEDFFTRSARQFLSGAEGENRVYSPLNLYMALAMLAEATDGQSRQQILDLLGTESLEALRAQAGALWNAHYCQDGATASVLANSLWLNQNISYDASTLEDLAAYYYASTFQGEMGSEGYNQALRDWINQQTGGLLEEQAGGLSMNPETLLALASTIYFKAAWEETFPKANTEPQPFYTQDGEILCDFMRQSERQDYGWGEGFSAVKKDFADGGGAMWLVLPDEGGSPEDLLEDAEFSAFLFSGEEWENRKSIQVNLSLPRFDVDSKLDLIPGLQELGMEDVFDGSVSDFSPISQELEGAAVTQAEQAARVKVNEEGCEAAAYTVMMVEESAMEVPGEEIDFVLDRPFLFAITGADGLPLFVGIVNQPA